MSHAGVRHRLDQSGPLANARQWQAHYGEQSGCDRVPCSGLKGKTHDATIVIACDMIGSRERERDLSAPAPVTRALTVRVADRFVLAELARLARSGVFAGRLDLGRIGMFGHSLGGAAAASTMLVHRRVRAGADLDGLLFGRVRTSGLTTRPFLLMNAEPGFAAEPNRAGFWKRLHGPRYAVDVKRAQHFAFSDLVFLVPVLMRTNPTAGQAARQLVGNVDGLATLAAERASISAFFDRSLRGEPQPLLANEPGPFAGVRLTVGR